MGLSEASKFFFLDLYSSKNSEQPYPVVYGCGGVA
jgi:hypothetical protein